MKTKQQGVIEMASKKHLQEIYGEEDNEVEVSDEEIGNALTEIIAELKEKYGDEWTRHIGENTTEEE